MDQGAWDMELPMNSPGRNMQVMTARAFIEELSREEATAIRAFRTLSS